ncbi:MAG: methylenetetrahydromethanopterin dehydrogenase [Thiotrichaceae bacterium]|nr:methylenetetrahydromethanopterin dehydrogenase [Thiotrichaceae bacterium]
MEKRRILHIFTPEKHASPFEVNMAVDAGYDVVVPYTQVALNDITALIQDAIFSRRVEDSRYTGIFIGGKDVAVAQQMLSQAKQAMYHPFAVSLLADPSEAFSTAAAIIALVMQQLEKSSQNLSQQKVVIFGSTSALGISTALLAAKQQANVTVVSHRSYETAQTIADAYSARYRLKNLMGADGSTVETRLRALENAIVVINAAKTGTLVLKRDELTTAQYLRVAVDTNAIPPAGIAGITLKDNAQLLGIANDYAVSFGAVPIRELKYKIQHQLFQQMLSTEQSVCLDFHNAFEIACRLLGVQP